MARIVVMPYGPHLAHVSRPLLIAVVLRNMGHEVIFAGDGASLRLARESGFPVVFAKEIPEEHMLSVSRKCRSSTGGDSDASGGRPESGSCGCSDGEQSSRRQSRLALPIQFVGIVGIVANQRLDRLGDENFSQPEILGQRLQNALSHPNGPTAESGDDRSGRTGSDRANRPTEHRCGGCTEHR